jgi:hypothetical protein
VIVDMAENLMAEPVDRHTLVAGLLLSLCWRRSLTDGQGGRDGALWLALGVALEFLGIAAGSWSIARLGLPIGVLGLARLLGAPGLRVAMLSVWLIPIPFFLISAGTPHVEGILTSAVSWALSF